jgi:NTE family protein
MFDAADQATGMSDRSMRSHRVIHGGSIVKRQAEKVVSLALQGGGAHGAFTWGVLDRLLEDERLVVEGISGASAGALNAALLAHGVTQGGRDGARRTLAAFWEQVSQAGRASPMQPTLLDRLAGGHGFEWSPGYRAGEALSQVLGPYELNPLNLNPLRDILLALVDFERLRQECPVKLFIAATQVRTGTLRVFRNDELTADVLLASACLPRLHQAVEIEGEAYWDGGYTGNPPVFPLIWHCRHRDIILVVLGPLQRRGVPRSPADIRSRESELMFMAAFLREIGAIAQAKEALERELFTFGRLERRLKRANLHVIEAEDLLSRLSPTSRLNTRRDFLLMLRDHGRVRAQEWLDANFDRLGTSSAVDLGDLLG